MSHIVNPTDEAGGQQDVRVSDDNVQQLLNKIWKELRIMNLHLSLITDTTIDSEEISGD